PAGAVAEICVADSTVNDVAALGPKTTAVAPFRLVPVMVTTVPPFIGPLLGLTPFTAGAVPTEVNWSLAVLAEIPAAVLTVMCKAPAAWAGLTAVREVADCTLNEGAGRPPKKTPLTLVKFVPVTVTVVPPPLGPEPGL